MFQFGHLLHAIGDLAAIGNLMFIVIGVVLGIVVGVIPGLGAPLGIAIALPFTFKLGATESFSLLLGIYSGSMYGGSISAIVLGIPGSPPAAATVMDGHPMFRQGRGAEALSLSLIGSVIGGIFATICLALLAPLLADVAVRFGPPETFAIAVFGVAVVGRISGPSPLKGVAMGAIGMLLTTFGIDPVNGNTRFLLGSYDMYSGIPLIPLLVGLFALPQMLENSEEIIKRAVPKAALKIRLPGIRRLFKFRNALLRSSIVGTIIGIVPAEGGAIAAFISYGEAKRASKHPESFGKGEPEGVIAAETAANASVGGALVPTLTLGIPGSAATAVLFGALLIQGLQPGPELIVQAPNLVYYIFVSLVAINVILLIVGWAAIGTAVRIAQVPAQILIPVVVILALVGSYATVGTLFGVWITILAGIGAYILRKFEFPVTPLVLGFVLGKIVEVNFRQSLTLSQGSLSIFFVKPISLAIFVVLFLVFVAPPIIKAVRSKPHGRARG